MRYGTIITTAFYGIILPKKSVDLIDGHFLAASHHRIRAINVPDLKLKQFHSQLYWKHVQAMMNVIASGNFKEVFRHDSVTGKNCHKPDGWLVVMQVNPQEVIEPTEFDHMLPSETLFKQMSADLRHPPGRSHPYDALLANSQVSPSQISLEPAAA